MVDPADRPRHDTPAGRGDGPFHPSGAQQPGSPHPHHAGLYPSGHYQGRFDDDAAAVWGVDEPAGADSAGTGSMAAGPAVTGSAGMPAGKAAAIAAGILILLGAVVAAVVLGGRIFGGSTDSSGSGSAVTVVETVTEDPAESAHVSTGVAEQPSSSAADSPAPAPTSTPRPEVSLTEVSVSGPTSLPFAQRVQADVMSYYDRYGEIPSSVESYSPTTQQSYRMTCEQYPGYVHCYGGNNANVYLR